MIFLYFLLLKYSTELHYFISSGERLIDLRSDLLDMFNEVIKLASENSSKEDKMQLTILHSSLQTPVFIHMRDIDNLKGEDVLDRFSKVLNSNESIKADESFEVRTGIMRLRKGAGKGKNRVHLFPHLNQTRESSILNKKSIVSADCNDDYLCAAKSLVICKAKLHENWRTYKNLIKGKSKKSKKCNSPNSLLGRAINLQRKAGLPMDRKVTISQLANFEKVLNCKIIVITFGNGIDPEVVQCSEKISDEILFLYLADEHYHAIVSYKSLFRKKEICINCLEIHPIQSKEHLCETKKCYVCNKTDCLSDGRRVFCSDCNFSCNSQICYDFHKTSSQKSKSICEKRKKCLNCQKIVNISEQEFDDHKCFTYKCSSCKKHVPYSHLCYLRRREPKLSTARQVYYDIETTACQSIECQEGYVSKKSLRKYCKDCEKDSTCLNCLRCENCQSPECGKPTHKCVMVVAHLSCSYCEDEELTPQSNCKHCGDVCKTCKSLRNSGCEKVECGKREIVFKGVNSLSDFGKWSLTKYNKDRVFIAHNASRFDTLFILNYCLEEAKIKPQVIFNAGKLVKLVVGEGLNIVFIDSMNFMNMALKKLPQAMGIRYEGREGEDMTKGFFPHHFNTLNNQNYVGSWPRIENYDLKSFSKQEREDFNNWYMLQVNKTFNLQEEMLKYCRTDVTILRLACVKFRRLFMEITKITDINDDITSIVDPFAHSTLAATCMQVFRANFIQEKHIIELADGQTCDAIYKGGKWFSENGEIIPDNEIIEQDFISSNITQIPPSGYGYRVNASLKSIAWLEYESKKNGTFICHSRNTGEKKINVGSKEIFVDGYEEETQIIYLFHGCFFHRHYCTFQDNVLDPKTKESVRQIRIRTKQNEDLLKNAGYRVKVMWECEFDRLCKTDHVLKDVVDNLDIPERFHIRQALFGGRTECFRLYHKCKENEKIESLDIISLYPFTMKFRPYPLCHPQIYTTNFKDVSEYFGLIHCRVLPPKHLRIPCLPVRLGNDSAGNAGKLVFPLCLSCAVEKNQGTCTHSDEERSITGCFTSPELQAAIKRGYIVKKIFEVYHYPEISQYDPETQTGGIFTEQIDLFTKLKTEASGFPKDCDTFEEKMEYIKMFKRKTGVQLDIEKIEYNAPLRSVCKMALNSFWGRFAMKGNRLKYKFISSTSEYDKLTSDSTINIRSVDYINSDILAMSYDKKQNFEEENFTTNELIACFTTSWARLTLLAQLEASGEGNLYSDTDSVIRIAEYSMNENGEVECKNPLKQGTTPGELLSDLNPGVHIDEFLTIAPKSYGLKLSTGAEIIKFKGVQFTFENSERINFKALSDLLAGNIEQIELEKKTQFVRQKTKGLIYNIESSKKLKLTFDKRRVLENFDTVPFGYVDNC